MDKKHPSYIAGWDAGMNGVTIQNCNFALFNTPENMKLWQAGKKDAESWKEKSRDD